MISYLENPKDSKITKTFRINSAKLQNTTTHANQLKIPVYNSNDKLKYLLIKLTK